MNIFEEYINKITALILKNQKLLKLDNLNNFKGIVVESPPVEFNFDLSCNASLVLGKINKINPKELANKIKDLILKDLKDFEKIEIAGPGFLNLKLTNKSLVSNINQILENRKDAPLRPFTLTIYLFFKAMPANFASNNPTILRINLPKHTKNSTN